MRPDRVEHLLGGWAAGTLTADERALLMREAARDQQLFNALADEEALRDALADPAFRARLLDALGKPLEEPVGKSTRVLAPRAFRAEPGELSRIEMAAYKIKPAEPEPGWWSWFKRPWPLAAAAALAGVALFLMITGRPGKNAEPSMEIAQNRVSRTQAPSDGPRPSQPAPAAPAPSGKKAAEGAQQQAVFEEKNAADARLTPAGGRFDQPAPRARERQRDEAGATLADQSSEGKKEKDAAPEARPIEAARTAAGTDRPAAPALAPGATGHLQIADARAKQATPFGAGASGRGGAADQLQSEKADNSEARPIASPPPAAAAPAAEIAASSMAKSQAALQFIHHIERRTKNGDWVRAEAASLRAGDAVRVSLLSPADAVIRTTIESPGAPPRSLQSDTVKAGQRIYIPRHGSLPSTAGAHRISIQSMAPDTATTVGFRSSTSTAPPSLSITLEFR
jgi:hypothetical protein